MLRPALLLTLAALLLAACDSVTDAEGLSGSATAPDASADARSFNANGAGVVFTLSDAVGANEVIVLARDRDGTLRQTGVVPTGGAGSGGGLGAATDPLVLSPDGRFLYAVNRGSDDISVFQLTGNRIKLRQQVASGGVGPLSLAIQDDLLYVLNDGSDGTPGNVVAFERRPNGRLSAIDGGVVTFPTDGSAAGLTQVGFSPDGSVAVVTARGAGNIFSLPVGDDGAPGALTTTASDGQTPFGFDFNAAGNLYVSNAAAGAPDASSVSAYALSGTAISTIEAEVPTTETAACWLRVDGSFFYVTNTGSGTITGYEILADGSVDILDADGVTATTGPNPRDLNIAGDFLYAQTDGQIEAFSLDADGGLTPLGTTSVPATTRGVASR